MAIKVAQVIPRVGCESSGPTYYMNNLIRRLEEVGCDVELFSLEKFCHLNLFNLGVSREMYGALKAKVPTMDIIHNNSLWMMPNLYAYWAAKDSACKVVTSPHGTLSQWALRHGKVKKIVFGNLFQYPALSRTDMFHATCVKEYDEIRRAGFFQPVAIIPIGITVGEHKGNRTGRRKAVFLGRLHKVKALDNLVLAWLMIANKFQDWELQIAGPDDGFRDSLIRIIEKNHVPRVSLVGELSGESKYEFLSSADLYIQPSYTENFGVTIAEAMSCGLPVIASRGTPWSGLESHECGWWIDVGIQPLASALENAMTLGESDLKSMGKRSREWMIREFDWNAIGERMKRSYEWILSPNEVQCPEWIVTD